LNLNIFYDAISKRKGLLTAYKRGKMTTTTITTYNPATGQYETSVSTTSDEDTFKEQQDTSSIAQTNNSSYHEIASVLSALQSSL
jgi:hypothetical protein